MSITSNNLKVREVINQVVNDPTYKQVAHVPVVSMHQVGLIILAYMLVFGGIALHWYADLTLWLVYPMMVFGFYTAFTPFHDATHRAVSSSNWLNDLLGTISGGLLFPISNTKGYRYLHLAHHRYVGDKDLDPDEPMVGIPTNYFPLGYLALLFPDLIWAHWILFKAWKRTPTKSRVNVMVMIVGNVLFHTLWFISLWGFEYLVLFFIPNRMAIAYTAWAFAHTPHPEGLHWNDFPFQTTFSLAGSALYTWSLYGQKHHSMHHFLPHIPWYKYFKVWDLANGVFRQQPIPSKPVFSFPDKECKDKVLKQLSISALPVEVVSVKTEAKGIKSFTFKSATDQPLPEFSAGAHIQITLPSGRKRSYSLVNAPFEKDHYQIAVKLDPNSTGGSKELHEAVQAGMQLEISIPRNHFVLYENVQKYILIAGGIGITPLLSMAHRLTEIDRPFELHICSKSMKEIPFAFELTNWTFAPNVEIHLDKQGRSSIELDKLLANVDQDTLIYVCGPSGFNHWVKQSALEIGWSKDQIKQEEFSREGMDLAPVNPFELKLQKSGKSITVSAEQTIIDALQMNNIKVPYSCMQGTCGTCVQPVVSGEIDHRDAFLNEEEKKAGKQMCLCVSRAKKEQIILDL